MSRKELTDIGFKINDDSESYNSVDVSESDSDPYGLNFGEEDEDSED